MAHSLKCSGLEPGLSISRVEMDVQILAKKKIPCDSQMHIHINSKMNVHGLRRSLFFLSDKGGNILHDTYLLQYHLAVDNDGEDLVFDVAPHGNRKHEKKKTILPDPEKYVKCDES